MTGLTDKPIRDNPLIKTTIDTMYKELQDSGIHPIETEVYASDIQDGYVVIVVGRKRLEKFIHFKDIVEAENG